MPSVTPWTPGYDFESDPDPQQLINAAALQAQLTQLASSLSELYTALALVIRDDDTLVDESVRLRNLHPELSEYLATIAEGTVVTNSLEYRFPVRVASTENLASLVGSLEVDDITLDSLDRVLLKNQTDASQNGLWVVHEVGDASPHAAGLWVRAADLPAAEASGAGWGVIVREGTLNGGTAWMIVAGGDEADQPVVGTDDLDFLPIFAPFPLPIARGGTGATTAVAARAALGVPGKDTGTIEGDDVTTVFTVPHDLATRDVIAGVVDDATNAVVLCSITVTTTSVIVAFSTAPATGETFTVTVVG